MQHKTYIIITRRRKKGNSRIYIWSAFAQHQTNLQHISLNFRFLPDGAWCTSGLQLRKGNQADRLLSQHKTLCHHYSRVHHPHSQAPPAGRKDLTGMTPTGYLSCSRVIKE